MIGKVSSMRECEPILGTVHYLRAGGGDFEGGYLFLASRRGGGALIFGRVKALTHTICLFLYLMN